MIIFRKISNFGNQKREFVTNKRLRTIEPRSAQIKIDEEKGHHRPLHLSVHYNGGNGNSNNGGWKQTLEPIIQENYQSKNTFTVYSPDNELPQQRPFTE